MSAFTPTAPNASDTNRNYTSKASGVVIERLTETNYGDWCNQIKLAILVEKLGPLLEGKLVENDKMNEDEKKKMREDSEAAFTLIFGSCGGPVQRSIAGLMVGFKAQEAWNTLTTRFQTLQHTSAYQIRTDFMNLRMDETTDTVNSWYAKLIQYQQRLENTIYPINDKEVQEQLCSGLPNQWTSVVVQAARQDTLSGALAMLLEVEPRVATQENKAFSAYPKRRFGKNRRRGKGKERKESEGRVNKPSGPCFYCKKEGHWKAKCPARKAMKGLNGADPQKSGDTEERALAVHGAVSVTQHQVVPSYVTDVRSTGFRASMATDSQGNETSVNWYLDSGATIHICREKSFFTSLKRHTDAKVVSFAGGESVECWQTGSVTLKVSGGTLTLYDVFLIPTATANLVSVSALNSRGMDVLFGSGGGGAIYLEERRVANAINHGGMRKLQCAVISSRVYASMTTESVQQDSDESLLERLARSLLPEPEENDELSQSLAEEEIRRAIELAEKSEKNQTDEGCDHLELWHRRFGHASKHTILRFAENIPDFRKPKGTKALPLCVDCLKGKMHETFNKETLNKAERALHRIHSDLSAKMIPGIGGVQYFQLFIDEYTRRVAVYFSDNKSAPQGVKNLKEFKSQVENETGLKIARIRDDRGPGEFKNNLLEAYLLETGIVQEASPAHKKAMNGLAERSMRTLQEMARTIRIDAGAPESFWPWSVSYSAYTLNRLPKQMFRYKSPEERWTRKAVKIEHLRPFGCKAIVFIHQEARNPGKWAERAWEGVLVGYQGDSIYRVLNVKTRKVLESADVKFVETEFPLKSIFSHQPTQGISKVRNPLSLQQQKAPSRLLETGVGESSRNRASPDARATPETAESGRTAQITESAPGVIVGPSVRFRTSAPNTAPESTVRLEDPPQTPSRTQAVTLETPARQETSASGPQEQDGTPQTAEVREQEEASKLQAVSQIPMRRSERIRRPKKFYNAAKASVVATADQDPETLSEALSRNPEGWGKSVAEELHGMYRMKVLEPQQDIPTGRKVVSVKWVFKTKLGQKGELERLKSRLCSRGFELRKGIDYDKVFAPTASMTTLRVFLAMAAANSWAMEQVDIDTAFLNAPLEEEVYIECPEGVELAGIPEWEEAKCFRLRKAMYGLNQSPRAWYKEIRHYLISMNLVPSEADPNLFVTADRSPVLLLYVDDMIIAGEQVWVDAVKLRLREKYSMKETGAVNTFIGVQVERDLHKGTLKIHQGQYIRRLLKSHGMQDCNPSKTPKPHSKLLPTSEKNELSDEEATIYRSMVGGVLWVSTATRPDVAYTVSKLARYFANPSRNHMIAAKQLLRYLKGTADRGITYGEDPESRLTLRGYTDSDWAEHKDNRRSTSGFVFMLYGGAVSWRSKLQTTTALSTMEAEYMALAYTARDVLWLHNLWREFHPEDTPSTEIFMDNKSAMDLAGDQLLTDKSKHIDIRYHFIRELVERQTIRLSKIGTTDMIADILTKSLPLVTHNRHCRGLAMFDA